MYERGSFTLKLLFAITGGVCLFLVARCMFAGTETLPLGTTVAGIVLHPPPAINHRVDE